MMAKGPSHYAGIVPVTSDVAVMPTPIHTKEIMIDERRHQLNIKLVGSHNPRHALVDVVEDVGVGAKKLITRSQNV